MHCLSSVLAVLPCVFVSLCRRVCPCKAFAAPSTSVRVFDNVFSSDACRLINELSIEHSERAGNCDGSSIFYREEGNTLTPLENAIDSVLAALGDTSDVVEYWSRENYMNIDAHADIDEGGVLEDGERIRCPKRGHILYLSVGKDVRGPTFIFPDKLVGWGYEDSSSSICRSSGEGQMEVEMVTVPVVEGRIVRFDGRAMHAVPKPADRWLLNEDDERLLPEKENDAFGAVDYGDDWDFWEEPNGGEGITSQDATEDVKSDRRSVLLFNTWQHGPAFVDEDPAIHMPSGIELSEKDGSVSGSGAGNAIILSEWEKQFGKSAAKVHCNKHNQWKDVPIFNVDTDDSSAVTGSTEHVRVNLMGNRQRRCYPKTSAMLSMSRCSVDTLKNATIEARTPKKFTLTEKM